VLMMLAGAAIRQFFVLRHGYKLGRNRHPLGYALVGVAVIVGAIVWMRPAINSVAASADGSSAKAVISYQELQPVLAQRCAMCHGPDVQMKGVRLDSAAAVQQHAQAIYQQAVVTKAMPMNNATGITDAERGLVRQWFEGGAVMQPRP